jgi:hypothetical protein
MMQTCVRTLCILEQSARTTEERTCALPTPQERPAGRMAAATMSAEQNNAVYFSGVRRALDYSSFSCRSFWTAAHHNRSTRTEATGKSCGHKECPLVSMVCKVWFETGRTMATTECTLNLRWNLLESHAQLKLPCDTRDIMQSLEHRQSLPHAFAVLFHQASQAIKYFCVQELCWVPSSKLSVSCPSQQCTKHTNALLDHQHLLLRTLIPFICPGLP